MSSPPTPASPVHIHGPALRVIRQLRGVAIADLAEALRVSVNYISMIETGARRRCSATIYAQLGEELGLADLRALLACPYGAGAHPSNVGDPGEHDGRWTPDSDSDTAALARPETGGKPATGELAAVPAQRGTKSGRHRRRDTA